jgi:SAM-dependent methyltransferase
MSQKEFWSDRYKNVGDQYLFGMEPNHYLKSHRDLIVSSGNSAMLVADGEGRNSIWLSEQGLKVTACDISPVAIEKAKKLSDSRDGKPNFICGDMLAEEFSEIYLQETFDWVVGIFIQFTDAQERVKQFNLMKGLTRSGGRILLQGYTKKQLEYKTGGPSNLENLYTKEILGFAFADWEIEELHEYEEVISEGLGHQGMSALIGMVARKPFGS